MSVDQAFQGVTPSFDQSAVPSVIGQNITTEQTWREFEAAGFWLNTRRIDRLASLYGLDETTIKRLVFLRYRLMKVTALPS